MHTRQSTLDHRCISAHSRHQQRLPCENKKYMAGGIQHQYICFGAPGTGAAPVDARAQPVA